MITPYASWPVIMFDKAVGMAWWHNMVSAKKMQSTCTGNPSLWKR